MPSNLGSPNSPYLRNHWADLDKLCSVRKPRTAQSRQFQKQSSKVHISLVLWCGPNSEYLLSVLTKWLETFFKQVPLSVSTRQFSHLPSNMYTNAELQ